MAVCKDTDCDFCGKVHPYISSNSFGVYCKDCLKIMIGECEDSIAEIEDIEGDDTNE
jgi:hypothetical protein